jgi:hypothetical protein
MSRLVRVPKRASDDLAIAGLEDMLPHGLGGAEDQQIATETDNYLERIAKYVPGEVSPSSSSSTSFSSRR